MSSSYPSWTNVSAKIDDSRELWRDADPPGGRGGFGAVDDAELGQDVGDVHADRLSLMNRSWAIRRLLSPSARRVSTCDSRLARLPTGPVCAAAEGRAGGCVRVRRGPGCCGAAARRRAWWRYRMRRPVRGRHRWRLRRGAAAPRPGAARVGRWVREDSLSQWLAAWCQRSGLPPCRPAAGTIRLRRWRVRPARWACGRPCLRLPRRGPGGSRWRPRLRPRRLRCGLWRPRRHARPPAGDGARRARHRPEG